MDKARGGGEDAAAAAAGRCDGRRSRPAEEAQMRRLREVAEKKAEELAAKIDEAADRAYLDSPVGDGGDRQLPFRRR